MKPHFNPKDLYLFYKYLNNATNYMEFGSGGSTYQASIRNNIKKIITIESDKTWIEHIKTVTDPKLIDFQYIELQTKPNTW